MKISISKNVYLASLMTALLLVSFSASLAMAKGKPTAECTTIQSGLLENTAGDTIPMGYMDNGYNYQSHMFNGDWGGDKLVMKWNDAWLSNKDCDGDLKLDRHYGTPAYIGSGAWLTNHFSGQYIDDNGKKQKWTYFIKIVAAPSDATVVSGVWYDAGGAEIGPVIWGSFAIIQELSNDGGAGEHGLIYKSAVRAGLGNW